VSLPDPRQLERDCLTAWEHAFEPNPSAREKFYLTVAYPYPSGAMHVGHGRTYIVPDVIARFWRMRGREVLYPMAFHVTGAPVIGISKRIARGDEKAIRLYRDLYKVPQKTLEQFVDPLAIVRHFSEEYQRVMRACGLSIDWRRRFTTVDPQYSKFIEWQWKHLREGGHVTKGAHPVRYCPQCENPVGDHDLLEGDRAEIQKFVLIMFRWKDAFIPAATLRPETIYGVTNLWVNPRASYVRAIVDGAPWIVSREAAEKLSLQDHTVSIEGEIPGSALVNEKVSHRLCGEVPVLPASFVDPGMATGMVMSVPGHAPFDYIALRDLQSQGHYSHIQPVSLIRVPGYGDFPAKDAIERAGVKDQTDPRMEAITQEVYSAEFSQGKLREEFGGMTVREARESVGALLVARDGSKYMYEFDTRPVICRCGGQVFVKILHDQWFLTYSDPSWKAEVSAQIEKMVLVPPEVRAEFERTVGWLKDWACTRRVGLGTRLPWDPGWLIEPLSDSTIYMAYYTVAHHLKEFLPEELTPDVFDYIFCGQPCPDHPRKDMLAQMRKEFCYWYPYDYRFSAKDLISNHLTFQLFHHVAIFPPSCLPRGMVVFGMGLLNGAKMSSSKGNVFLLEDAVMEFGADTVRMFLVGSAEPWQDFDWRNELVQSTRKQIERFYNTIQESRTAPSEVAPIDRWLISRLQQHIQKTTQALEVFQTRQALQEAFYAIDADLKWHRRRIVPGTPGGGGVRELAHVWTRLMAPVIPFICERLWKEIGGEGLVSFADWPVPDQGKIDLNLELAEEMLLRLTEDLESIRKVIQITPRSLTICIAPAWKREIFAAVAGAADKTRVVKDIMGEERFRKKGKDAADAVRQCITHVHRLPPGLVEGYLAGNCDEREIFFSAIGFLEKEAGVPVTITDADAISHPRAKGALPLKPALILE